MVSRPVWLHTDPHLTAAGWRHGWTDNRGPDFGAPVTDPAHAAAVAALAEAVGLDGAAWVNQVHGGEVRYVDRPGPAGEADALWTDRPKLGTVGRSADCPLILLGGHREGGEPVWGFAHASWRATVRGLSHSLVRALCDGGVETATIRACICPSAGPCCYEVGPEVRQEALERLGPTAGEFFSDRGDRFVFDLWAANTRQLCAAGVAAERIARMGICTICAGDPWPSYRRQGTDADRFAAIVGVSRKEPS